MIGFAFAGLLLGLILVFTVLSECHPNTHVCLP